jgi:hypothetical protein
MKSILSLKEFWVIWFLFAFQVTVDGPR